MDSAAVASAPVCRYDRRARQVVKKIAFVYWEAESAESRPSWSIFEALANHQEMRQYVMV